MNEPRNEPQDSQLFEVAERLRSSKPQATALELDQIKLQARERASRKQTAPVWRPRGALLKSRLALTMIVAVGLLMSGTGASVALQTFDSSGRFQYSEPQVLICSDGFNNGFNNGFNSFSGGSGRFDDDDDDDGFSRRSRDGDLNCNINRDSFDDDDDTDDDNNEDVRVVLDDDIDDAVEAADSNVEGAREVAQGGGSDELAFTGFAAIPLLIGGLIMSLGGLLLRRRT